MKKYLFLLTIPLYLSSCSAWVVEKPESKTVQVLTSTQAASCQKVGKTKSNVRDHYIVGVKRGDDYVLKDLENLAKNQAAEMGANAIVPLDDYKDGTQTFEVFKCE